MGLWDGFKNLVGIEDVEDDEDDIEEEVKEEPKKEIKQDTSFRGFEKSQAPRVAQTSSAAPSKPEAKPEFKNTLSGKTQEMKMMIVEPAGFEECPKLVDSLKAKKPIVINLENLETDVARKIFDFLSGATYALNGNVQRITNNIFLFAPANVDISHNGAAKVQTAENPLKSPWN